MLEAREHVTAGTRRPAPNVTCIHDGSTSTDSAVLDKPSICIDDWPQSS